jgi:ABC-2 type transport system permease protein
MTMTRNAVRSIFSLFFFIGRRARRTKAFFLIGCLPVAISLVLQLNQIFSRGALIDGPSVFLNIILSFYLQFLILMLALFYGTSICSEELEGKTLTYLTTRPVSKSAIILGKYAAYMAFLIGAMAAGIVASFLILHIGQISEPSAWTMLFRSMGVLVTGLFCYTAFFTFLGTFFKRAVIFGLFFSFGWENVVQYFPGSTQKFTIIHYLKSLLPAMSSDDGKISFLRFNLEPSHPAVAIVTLLVLTVVFLCLACLVFSRKEYIFED